MAKISTVTVDNIQYKLVGSGGDDPIVEGTLTDLQTFTANDGTIWNAQSPNIEDTYFVDTDKNILYRFSGTQFTALGSGLALGETENTAYAGNKGKANADKIATLETAINNKVDKVTQQYQVYGTDRNAQQVALPYDVTPHGNSIVQRDSSGKVKGVTATEDNDLPNFLQVKNLLKTAMPKHKYVGDIYENAFYQWCQNTPNVMDGALFSVETETETPAEASIGRGFPLLQSGTILYGYFYNGLDESPIVIFTEKGNYKIINGASNLTCSEITGIPLVNINLYQGSGTFTKEEYDILMSKKITAISTDNEQTYYKATEPIAVGNNVRSTYFVSFEGRNYKSARLRWIKVNNDYTYTSESSYIPSTLRASGNKLTMGVDGGQPVGDSIDFKTIGGESIFGTGDIPAGGGITYEEILPDPLLGKWYFNKKLSTQKSLSKTNVSFTSEDESFTSIEYRFNFGSYVLYYDSKYIDTSWKNDKYRTIEITDISTISDKEEFKTWLETNAVKQ